jgi:hypothetical protein
LSGTLSGTTYEEIMYRKAVVEAYIYRVLTLYTQSFQPSR